MRIAAGLPMDPPAEPVTSQALLTNITNNSMYYNKLSHTKCKQTNKQTNYNVTFS